MKSQRRIVNIWGLAVVAVVMLAGVIQAASITYIGHQVDIESDDNTPTSGWRNPTPAKPLDIDGDSILGTDGWCLANTQSDPPYATITSCGAWARRYGSISKKGPVSGNAAWGLLDNPADPSGEDTIVLDMIRSTRAVPGQESGPMVEFAINGSGLEGKTLRVGVLCDIEWAGRDYTLSLTQRLGGTQQRVTTPKFTTEGTALDVAFFDITGAKEGDTFMISGTANEVGGIIFDTAPTATVPKVTEPEGVVRSTYDAPLELCAVFIDNAVLQWDRPLPVWGWDDPGTVVTVKFADQTAKATADKTGRWTAELKPLKAEKTPGELVVSAGETTITRKNILVGDVWLCAGQSNMEMHFSKPFVAPKMPCDTPDFVKPEDFPTIRHLRIGTAYEGYADHPQVRLPKSKRGGYEWTVCGTEAYKTFTAVGFFFAYTISKEVGVPIGLINVSKGNTDIVTWLAPVGVELVKVDAPAGVFDNRGAFSLFHGRVAPIAGLGIKGMLWYQGERNGGQGESYFWKMKALIHGWREAWGRDDIPFYFVQLPSFNGRGSWAPTREAQRKALTIPHTGMAVLTDAGNNEASFPANLHPRNKYTVGHRLGLWALAKNYGKEDLVYSGPLFKSAAFKDGKAIVAFDHIGSGLMAAKKEDTTSPAPPKPVEDVVGFEVAEKAGKRHAARASIEGDTVVVSSPEVAQPTTVRYLYTMNTDHGTLYNKEGLPASPFTTEPLR